MPENDRLINLGALGNLLGCGALETLAGKQASGYVQDLFPAIGG